MDLGPSTSTTQLNNPSRPLPRVITELPPPSQLDIEWSPVLTKNNERILKLGNLFVTSTPTPHSPSGKGESESKKFRLFGGNTTKKRQRLVMVTSSARIILAAAGGDEKKSKLEISLLTQGCTWRSNEDSKGYVSWNVDCVSVVVPEELGWALTRACRKTNISFSRKSAPPQLRRRAPATLRESGLRRWTELKSSLSPRA